MWTYRWAARRGPHSGCSRLLPGILAIAGWLAASAAQSAAQTANETKSCDLFLDRYQESGKLAEFKVALRCDGAQNEAFPINEPLLIGLTATTSDNRENDRVEIEYDFPVQNAVVSPDTTAVNLTFHAQISDISGKRYVYAKAWPRSFLQDCADGRSGCLKFGYALAMPASLSQSCVAKEKDGSGEYSISEGFLCNGSTDYRFKFR